MQSPVFVLVFFSLLLVCHGRGQIHHSRNSNLIRNAASDPSLALAVVNTNILTIFDYNGAQIYIYSALSNENENKVTPQKWLFYYVPIMAATISTANDSWISVVNSEIRLKLMLGNEEVQDLAIKAIVKKFDGKTGEYSKFWTVAPLMIDSLTASIIDTVRSPVAGVFPYRIVHPNTLTMTFRFQCSSPKAAQAISSKMKNGGYEIEVAFYFAGFKQVTTNFVSITSDQLRNVLSKTTADGGNSDAIFIHRNQAGKFIGNYITNIKKMIYMENTNVNSQSLISGLEEQFISLLQQGMNTAQQTVLDAKLFDQVWSSSDLNPDLLTSELSKLFTYNDTETKRKNDTNKYFNLNKQHLQSSSNSASGGGEVSFLGIGVGGNGASSSSSSLHHILQQTNHDIYSLDEIQRFLTQQQSEFQWTGEKFQAKSFNVYKLVDLTDRLQVAIIAKQLIADKNNGAILRTISTLNPPIASYTNKPALQTFITGMIQLYAGNSIPSLPWLLCDGAAVSRIKYQRLFSIVGTSYGVGDDQTTFNLPDFRERFPRGVDGQRKVGRIGGHSTVKLTTEHLPSHSHSSGTLSTLTAGNHSHSYQDPGHDHGGRTGNGQFGGGSYRLGQNGNGNSYSEHSHSISRDRTYITIEPVQGHQHEIQGQTEAVGSGASFSVVPPYQTVNYIIYTD